MVFYGPRTDAKPLCHRLVGKSSHNQFEDLRLPFRQPTRAEFIHRDIEPLADRIEASLLNGKERACRRERKVDRKYVRLKNCPGAERDLLPSTALNFGKRILQFVMARFEPLPGFRFVYAPAGAIDQQQTGRELNAVETSVLHPKRSKHLCDVSSMKAGQHGVDRLNH
ncbi:hypothetical protein [Hyphomicrobium sp. MC8b]|uniref:hypothetical protein n=1 Tax=Hyphomicrobium sp. MC8b TaxID=300273 RepID=UPI00391C7C15